MKDYKLLAFLLLAAATIISCGDDSSSVDPNDDDDDDSSQEHFTLSSEEIVFTGNEVYKSIEITKTADLDIDWNVLSDNRPGWLSISQEDGSGSGMLDIGVDMFSMPNGYSESKFSIRSQRDFSSPIVSLRDSVKTVTVKVYNDTDYLGMMEDNMGYGMQAVEASLDTTKNLFITLSVNYQDRDVSTSAVILTESGTPFVNNSVDGFKVWPNNSKNGIVNSFNLKANEFDFQLDENYTFSGTIYQPNSNIINKQDDDSYIKYEGDINGLPVEDSIRSAEFTISSAEKFDGGIKANWEVSNFDEDPSHNTFMAAIAIQEGDDGITRTATSSPVPIEVASLNIAKERMTDFDMTRTVRVLLIKTRYKIIGENIYAHQVQRNEYAN